MDPQPEKAVGLAPRRGGGALRARVGGALRLLHQPRAWSELATRLSAGDRVHQDHSLTWSDRYPRLFAAARELLADRPDARLLSFGCSSGEEVLTLRQYFPRASIVGAEINHRLLRTCRRLPVDEAIRFIPSTPAALAESGPYDAIFCMAVFTRRPHEIERRGLRDIGNFYPYHRFAEQLRDLVLLLADGGLLIVEHALYRVEDAVDGLPMRRVESHGMAPAKGPRFDPSGALIEPVPVIARIFRKEGAA